MKQRRLSASLSLFVATVIAMVAIPATGLADSPTSFGWWTNQNQGAPAVPIPTLVPGQPSGKPNDLVPDVPAGGFEITNAGPDTAYAAIGYEANGRTVQQVVLTLAPNADNLPNSTVQACPLTSTDPFPTDDGGPMSNAPAYDCTTPAPGVVDPASNTVSFAVGTMVRNDYLGIAIVATGSASRMVFNPPSRSTVHAASSPAGSDATPAPLTIETPAALAAESATAAPITTPDVPTRATADAPPAAPPSPAATAAPTTPSVLQAADAVGASSSSGTLGVGSAVIGAILVALVALGTALHNRRVPAMPS